MDQLRAARFLMCAPLYYTVEYVINPWMGSGLRRVRPPVAEAQWNGLRATLESLPGVEVTTVDPAAGWPDMVFTANAGFVARGVFVPSAFRHAERAGEEPYFTQWAEDAGFHMLRLPSGIAFEGAGDSLFDRALPILWMGHGYRTDAAAAAHLADLLGPMGYRVEPLALAEPRFYHLDTCFCPLAGGALLYYPPAFDAESRGRIEALVPADRRIAVGDADAIAFACNAVNVGRSIVLNAATPNLRRRLEDAGFTAIETPLTEYLYAGGSAKCLTLRLDEPWR